MIVQCMKGILKNYFREHEWFQKDLPAYLFPASNDQDTSLINTSALMEVCEVSKKILIYPPSSTVF